MTRRREGKTRLASFGNGFQGDLPLVKGGKVESAERDKGSERGKF